jgi:hypothetical protein
LADGGAELVAVKQASEWAPFALPVLCHDPETNVLREQHPALLARQFQQLLIRQAIRAFLNRVDDIHTAAP